MGLHEHFAQNDARIRQALDYDDSVAPTDAQAILWVPSNGKWAPRTITPAGIGAVATTGNESISGVKTFNSAPLIPVGGLLANPVRRDDSRLTDARTPTSHASTHATGGSDALTAAQVGAAASTHSHGIGDLPVAASGASSSTALVRADDSRMSNSRTPTSHASSHATGQADAIAPSTIGAAAAADESNPSTLVPNGFVGADSSGRVSNAMLYSANESQYGVMRGRDAAYHASPTGARNDRGIYGDDLSPFPRVMAPNALTAALAVMYQTATIAAFDDTVTKCRTCTRSASAGTGTYNVAVFHGSDPTNLPRVATSQIAANVANGMIEQTLSNSVSIIAGQWLVVAVILTGYSTIPQLATCNVPSALLNGNNYQMGATRSASVWPSSISLASGGSGSGQVPWWALL